MPRPRAHEERFWVKVGWRVHVSGWVGLLVGLKFHGTEPAHAGLPWLFKSTGHLLSFWGWTEGRSQDRQPASGG